MAAIASDAAIRKRTQIAKANRTMFLWIAVASALIGAAVVVSIFLVQKLSYNEKVLLAKQQTLSTIDHNNATVSALEDEVRLLDTNTQLANLKANEGDQTLQVILDALPSEANSNALGASLQNKLLNGINGLRLESMQVDPVVGVELLTDTGASAAPVATAGSNTITFQFVVAGSEENLKQALQNLERSIRTIKILSLKLEMASTGPTMTVQAQAYYEPAKNIQLTEEVVKP